MERGSAPTEYPRDRCVHDLFREQAERTPDAVALVFGERTLTYRELDELSDRLAGALQGLGVGPEVLVGVCLERSVELIVALLGILKTGGAYVPLDPDYPAQRLAFMLEDTRAPVLLVGERLPTGLSDTGLAGAGPTVLRLDRNGRSELPAAAAPGPAPPVHPDNLAYVTYTSGSTGRPKGAAVTHRGVVRLVKGANYARLDRSETFLQAAPVSFDASTLEIWGPLLNGGRLVVMPPGVPSLEDIARVIKRHGVTTLWLTAGLFNLMVETQVDNLRGLRQLLFGGDVASPAQIDRAVRELADCRLINGYGPTENTTFTTCYTLPGPEELRHPVPIGRPVSNTTVYVLDERMEPVPVGVAGELYTGGDGLARGYHARPDLTAERFVPDPFGPPGSRLYRTGDLVRYLPDGNIEFLGRLDHQVKIRGFRVELGEVEAVLRRHPAVREVVVTAREDRPGNRRLVAYVIPDRAAAEAAAAETAPAPADETGLTAAALRSFLAERLPEWMLPAAFVFVGAFPLDPNGKIDRRALPEPGTANVPRSAPVSLPRDETELRLVELWEELLGTRPVGVKDNFFELGGNSLLAVRLIDRVRGLTGEKLPLAALFQAPTVENLAALLRDRHRQAPYSPLAPLRTSGSRRPIFCVHAAGGLVFYYTQLVRRLDPDLPVYGLQARGAFGDAEPVTEVREMASRYVEAVRSIQHAGPYRLVGYCMGGVVAYEMAALIEEQGEAVEFLGLINTTAVGPDSRPPEEPAWIFYAAELVNRRLEPADFITKLAALEPGLRLERLMSRGVAGGVLPPGINGPAEFAAWLELYRANVRIYFGYRPPPFGGRVVLFRSAEPGGPEVPPLLGWGQVAGERVEAVTVPGDHFTMVTEPRVEHLARELEARLGR